MKRIFFVIALFAFFFCTLWGEGEVCHVPEDSPLFWGNPSGATADSACFENYLMEKPQFCLSYNASTLNPNWVAWHLCLKD